MNWSSAVSSPSAKTADASGTDMWTDSGASSGVLRHLSGVLWNSRDLSDVTVRALGCEFHLHRLLLYQSPTLRKLLPDDSPRSRALEIDIRTDDPFVTAAGFETALGHLYGRPLGRLNPREVMGVLASARCLEITELCHACVAFVASSLGPANFLEYFRFAGEWEAGGEWSQGLANLTWTFLCRTAAAEMRPLLPSLPLEVLQKLMVADELWIESEVARFELIVHALGPSLEQARGSLDQAVIRDVMCNILDATKSSPSWNRGQVGFTTCGEEIGNNKDTTNVNLDARIKGQKRGKLEIPPQPTAKRCRIQDTMVQSFFVATTGSPRQKDSDSTDHSQKAFGHIPWVGFDDQDVGMDDLKGEDPLPESLSKASDLVARIESVLSEFLGKDGCVQYGAMSFDSLLQVRERLHEMDFPGVHDALQHGLWCREILHSLVSFTALRENTLKCNSNLHNASSLRSLAKDVASGHVDLVQGQNKLPRLRYSVEFEDLEHLGKRTRSDLKSKQVFFAGSLFRVVLSMHMDKDSKQKMVGIFLHRVMGFNDQLVDLSGFVDPRREIDVCLKVIAGTVRLEVIETRGRLCPPHCNKGYSKLLPLERLKEFLSPTGTLRVTIIVSLLFNSLDLAKKNH